MSLEKKAAGRGKKTKQRLREEVRAGSAINGIKKRGSPYNLHKVVKKLTALRDGVDPKEDEP